MRSSSSRSTRSFAKSQPLTKRCRVECTSGVKGNWTKPTQPGRLRPTRLSRPGLFGLGAGVLDVGPAQFRRRPQAGEHSIGGVGETVPVPEVIQTTAALRRQTGPLGPTHGVGVPCRGVGEVEVTVSA